VNIEFNKYVLVYTLKAPNWHGLCCETLHISYSLATKLNTHTTHTKEQTKMHGRNNPILFLVLNFTCQQRFAKNNMSAFSRLRSTLTRTLSHTFTHPHTHTLKHTHALSLALPYTHTTTTACTSSFALSRVSLSLCLSRNFFVNRAKVVVKTDDAPAAIGPYRYAQSCDDDMCVCCICIPCVCNVCSFVCM